MWRGTCGGGRARCQTSRRRKGRWSGMRWQIQRKLIRARALGSPDHWRPGPSLRWTGRRGRRTALGLRTRILNSADFGPRPRRSTALGRTGVEARAFSLCSCSASSDRKHLAMREIKAALAPRRCWYCVRSLLATSVARRKYRPCTTARSVPGIVLDSEQRQVSLRHAAERYDVIDEAHTHRCDAVREKT